MTTMVNPQADVPSAATPVRKTLTVNTSVEHAFRVFTGGIDSWWPRAHHIGRSPMKRIVVEPRARGRCYTEQVDGTECEWGTVLAWEPPRRFAMAWQITPDWQYEPDLAKSSEVEVQFTALDGGRTRVDLEHRHFERYGAASAAIRAVLDSPSAWEGTLALFAARAEQSASEG